MSAPILEFDIDPVWGETIDWEALANRAAEATARIVPELAHENLLISLVMADDEEVHALNKQWRAKDKPTNVLSFPMMHPDDMPGMPEILLGDIVLALGVCTREAEEKAVPMPVHASHLIVHGVLHLLGYDHMAEEEATAMEAIERLAMADLGLPDPYQD